MGEKKCAGTFSENTCIKIVSVFSESSTVIGVGKEVLEKFIGIFLGNNKKCYMLRYRYLIKPNSFVVFRF